MGTQEAVLWAFHHAEDFREGAPRVMNLVDDTDATGAIFRQIAGAGYGVARHPAGMAEVTGHGDGDRILGGPALRRRKPNS